MDRDFFSVQIEPGFWTGGTEPEGSARLLWLCVLLQAFFDLHSSDAQIRQAAHQWFYSDRRDLGSLAWICLQLDLSPTTVRERALSVRIVRPGRVPRGALANAPVRSWSVDVFRPGCGNGENALKPLGNFALGFGRGENA